MSSRSSPEPPPGAGRAGGVPPPRAASVAEIRARLDAARASAPHDAGHEAPTLLDVRDEAAFAAGHLVGSGHLPADALAERRAELPPRHHPVVVLAESAVRARAAAEALHALGYTDVVWLDAPLTSVGEAADARGAALRMWRPAAFLAEVVAAIPRGRAADLAAGSGREAAFLAERGFDVEAWDEAPEALERARELARRAGFMIRTCVADLEARSFELPHEHYALITGFRFLHRPLFPVMARALAPGGHLVYETYRKGQERFGRPRRPQFLLQPGELERAFLGLGFEILRYEETDPPEGPLTARLWARKR